MMLLTKANRNSLPALYSQEHVPINEQVVQVKFFTPDSSWTWWAVEFDGEDRFFGWATDGANAPELGYFSLSELRSARGAMGLPVERDRYFSPTRWADVAS